MGGAHTIRHGLTHPELFGYLGIFSMGLAEGDDVSGYEAQNEAALRRAADELQLLYFAMGVDDFLYNRVAPTRAMRARWWCATRISSRSRGQRSPPSSASWGSP